MVLKNMYLSKNNDTGFGLYFVNNHLLNIKKIPPMVSNHVNDIVRLTLDYEEDFRLIEKLIYEVARHNNYSINFILKKIGENPDWIHINKFRQEENNNRSSDMINLKYQNNEGVEFLIDF